MIGQRRRVRGRPARVRPRVAMVAREGRRVSAVPVLEQRAVVEAERVLAGSRRRDALTLLREVIDHVGIAVVDEAQHEPAPKRRELLEQAGAMAESETVVEVEDAALPFEGYERAGIL